MYTYSHTSYKDSSWYMGRPREVRQKFGQQTCNGAPFSEIPGPGILEKKFPASPRPRGESPGSGNIGDPRHSLRNN